VVTYADVVAQRVAAAHQYLRFLHEPTATSWQELYARYRDGQMSLMESMTLLDPQWLPAGLSQIEAQGPRVFPAATIVDAACEAAAIWGYPCDLPRLSRTQSDHLFPYALGGPTVAANRLGLCDVHNRVKGTDVHLFPWERSEPSFLSAQLARLSRLIVG
jgi:hypothetical protein